MQDEDLTLSLWELAHTRWGAVTISSAVLALAAMSVFVYIEVLPPFGCHIPASASLCCTSDVTSLHPHHCAAFRKLYPCVRLIVLQFGCYIPASASLCCNFGCHIPAAASLCCLSDHGLNLHCIHHATASRVVDGQGATWAITHCKWVIALARSRTSL